MADITLDDLQAGRGYEHWATQSQMASLIDQTKEIPRIAGFFQQLSQASSKETNLPARTGYQWNFTNGWTQRI